MDYTKWKKYKINKEDCDSINEAFEYIYSAKMKLVFKNHKYLQKVIFVTYDSENIFLFYRSNQSTVKQSIEITNGYYIDPINYRGMRAKIEPKELLNLIPNQFKTWNIISGGLMTPFCEIQKEFDSIYITKESYISQIVHEFGHIYFNSQNSYYLNNKKDNINIYKLALDLYTNDLLVNLDLKFTIPSYISLSEVFAFCTEYYFAESYFTNYKNTIDKYALELIKNKLSIEENIDYTKQDSLLTDSHLFSFVLGKIIYEKYESNWVDVLISSKISF